MGFDSHAGILANSIAAVLSISQLVAYYLVGNKHQSGWWVGIAGGAPWLAFMITSNIWGMAPLVIGLQVIYIRNLLKWRREARAATGTAATIPQAT